MASTVALSLYRCNQVRSLPRRGHWDFPDAAHWRSLEKLRQANVGIRAFVSATASTGTISRIFSCFVKFESQRPASSSYARTPALSAPQVFRVWVSTRPTATLF